MTNQRVPICIAGLNHDHVIWILHNLAHPQVEVVGFYEPDRALAQRYAAQFGFSMQIVYDDLAKMLDTVKPVAVAAFGSIYDHLKVVEACAPRGIHVMVEKPLAVNGEHAAAMAELALRYNIHLITNFETSWYATTYEAYERVVKQKQIGAIRKIVVHDGHFGPKEIGCSADFLAWLTDPVLNGGGAVVDFGCYGANLAPWLMGGTLPVTVSAVTQTLKPAIYPKVDDEANIILTYPNAVAILEGSWNWPIGRKDMEIYGESGAVLTVDATRMKVMTRKPRQNGWGDDVQEEDITLDPLSDPRGDPFAYLAGVVLGQIEAGKDSLYSLENNLPVVRILDAARESARTGKTVKL
jgi:predicted dehydrogenase